MSSHFSARGQRLAFALIAVVELALFYLDARTIMHVHTPLDGRFQYLAGRVRNLEDLRHSGNIYQQFSAEAFTYPPGAIILFWPLQWLSATARDLLWTLMSLCALWGTFVVALRRVTTWSWPYVGLVSGASVLITSWCCNPVLCCLQWGQTALLLQFLIVVDMLVIRGPRRGILLGIAVAINLFPALFLVALLFRREWRALRTAVVTFFVVTGIAAVVWPRSSWYFFRHVLLSGQELSHFNTSSNLVNDTGIAAPFNRPPFWGGTEPHLVRYALCVGVALWGLALAQRAWRKGYELTSVVSLLVVDAVALPNVWIHYYAFVPLIVVVAFEWTPSRHRPVVLALAATLCLPFVYWRTIGGSGPVHSVVFQMICDADAALALGYLLATSYKLFAYRGSPRRRHATSFVNQSLHR